jgi:K+-transporting ATPase ATPase A chain
MNANIMVQVGLFLVLLLAVAKPVGLYITQVMAGTSRANRIGGPLENIIYRIGGIKPNAEMNWKTYALALLLFNLLGVLAVYILQRTQQWLPLNPQQFGAVSADSSFNTAVSFAPTPTGRVTAVRARWVIWCRCWGWRCRTSCRRQRGLR